MSTSIQPSNTICYFEKPPKPLPQELSAPTGGGDNGTPSLLPQASVVGTDSLTNRSDLAKRPAETSPPAIGPSVNALGEALGTLINVSA